MELETNVAFLLQSRAQHQGVFGRNETLNFLTSEWNILLFNENIVLK